MKRLWALLTLLLLIPSSVVGFSQMTQTSFSAGERLTGAKLQAAVNVASAYWNTTVLAGGNRFTVGLGDTLLVLNLISTDSLLVTGNADIQSPFIFNDEGNAIDARFEGDTKDSLLVIDGSNDRVRMYGDVRLDSTVTIRTLSVPGRTVLDSLDVQGPAVLDTVSSQVSTVQDLRGTGDIDFTNGTVTVAAPTENSHASTKFYVDNASAASGGNEFADDVFRVQDNADATKEFAFQISGVTSGQTRTGTIQNTNGTFEWTGHSMSSHSDDGTLATKTNINDGDWSGTDLAIANGGTNTSSFAGSDHVVYFDGSKFKTHLDKDNYAVLNVVGTISAQWQLTAAINSSDDLVDKNYVDTEVASAGGAAMRSEEFTTSGTWTRPNDVDLVWIFAIGGGGGGGGATAIALLRALAVAVAVNFWNGGLFGSMRM